MIHLDTCFLVDLLRESKRGKPGPATAFLGARKTEIIGISVFVACEVHAGARLSPRSLSDLDEVQRLCSLLYVDYPDERFAPAYGVLFGQMSAAHQQISTMDLLIATTAVVAGAPLVTRNQKDFVRVPGLKIIEY